MSNTIYIYIFKVFSIFFLEKCAQEKYKTAKQTNTLSVQLETCTNKHKYTKKNAVFRLGASMARRSKFSPMIIHLHSFPSTFQPISANNIPVKQVGYIRQDIEIQVLQDEKLEKSCRIKYCLSVCIVVSSTVRNPRVLEHISTCLYWTRIAYF